MKWLAFVLLLSGCVTVPDNARFAFRCDESGVLWVAAMPEGTEDGWVAPVGHCDEGGQHIGPRKMRMPGA